MAKNIIKMANIAADIQQIDESILQIRKSTDYKNAITQKHGVINTKKLDTYNLRLRALELKKANLLKLQPTQPATLIETTAPKPVPQKIFNTPNKLGKPASQHAEIEMPLPKAPTVAEPIVISKQIVRKIVRPVVPAIVGDTPEPVPVMYDDYDNIDDTYADINDILNSVNVSDADPL